MKKIISTLLLALMLISCTNISAQAPITVVFNDHELNFDVSPINRNDRILVPLRTIFEAFGATVIWNADQRTAISVLGDTKITLTIDDVYMMINDKIVYLDVSPIIVADRTMVPVRVISKAFGADVSWDGSHNRVIITTADYKPQATDTKIHETSKTLSSGDISANAAFSISYPETFEVETNLASGTDIAILSTSDSHYAELAIRTDIYTGSPLPMNNTYAQSLAKSIASMVNGTYISGGVVTIGSRQFIEIRYSGYVNSSTLGAVDTYVTCHKTAVNGVMYTLTYTCYGDVPESVSQDMSNAAGTFVINQ